MADSSQITLFTVREMLERIGQQNLTGCLHVFRSNNAGNIYIKDGFIVASNFQQQLDRPAINAILEARNLQILWLPGQEAQFPNLQLPIGNFLADHKKSDSSGFGVTPLKTSVVAPQPRPSTLAAGQMKHKTAKLPAIENVETAAAPAPAKCAFYLQSLEDHRIILVEKEGLIIGRDTDADIQVDHASVSRRHCALRFTPQGLHFMDLNSTNGIYVNGQRLQGEGVAANGDSIVLGQVPFRVHKHEMKAAAAPVTLSQSRNGIMPSQMSAA